MTFWNLTCCSPDMYGPLLPLVPTAALGARLDFEASRSSEHGRSFHLRPSRTRHRPVSGRYCRGSKDQIKIRVGLESVGSAPELAFLNLHQHEKRSKTTHGSVASVRCGLTVHGWGEPFVKKETRLSETLAPTPYFKSSK